MALCSHYVTEADRDRNAFTSVLLVPMTQGSANLQFDMTSHCMQCASAETEALYAIIYS